MVINAQKVGRKQINKAYLLESKKLNMDESSGAAMKLELPATPVQQLLKSTSSANQVPERYIFQPDNLPQPQQSCIPLMDTPLIDLQSLLDSSSPDSQLQLVNLRSLLCTWGCFQLINHGIGKPELDKLREVAKQFFGLPHEEKAKHSRSADWFEGYGSDTVSEGQPFNWNDRLHLKIHPVDQRNLKFWPQNPANFRETLDEYGVGMKKVVQKILKAIAKSLEVEEKSFNNEFGDDGIMFTRFNYYPPCSSPEKVFGLKPHSDVTMITILVQDEEVEGLQVLKDEEWFKVPIIPGALFINVGDQLEIMSNGIMKSVVHKVVIDKERERITVAAATMPSPNKEIGPLDVLIQRQGAQLYKRVTNYVTLFLQHIAKSERAINALKFQLSILCMG